MESKRIIDLNSELPHHILQVIFSKLPIFNLPICRLVCKVWNDLVLDYASTTKVIPNTFLVGRVHNQFPPYKGMGQRYLKMHCIDFDKKQLERMSFVASFGFDCNWTSKVCVTNSCNALLCMITRVDPRRTTNVVILNPMTNEYIQLPVDYKKHHWSDIYYYGLGFSLKTKQYKIVRVRYKNITKHISLVEVLRLGRDSEWSLVGSVPFMIEKHCVYFNGSIYWVGEDRYRMKVKVICRLEVEDEKFEAIYLPEICRGSNMAIGTFNGCLYVTCCKLQYHKFEVWTKQSYGGEDSWIKEFVIDCIPKNWAAHESQLMEDLKLIKAYDDGEILCLVYGLYLFLYNPKTKRIKALNKVDRTERTLWVCQIESLNFGSLEKVFVGDG